MSDSEKLFQKALHAKTESFQWKLIRKIRKIQDLNFYSNLLQFLNHQEVSTRGLSARILAQFGTEKSIKQQTLSAFLNRLTSETEESVLSELLFGIGHCNDKITKEQVNQLTSIEPRLPETLYFEYVFALLQISQKSATSALIRMSQNKASKVRNWATFGLGSQISINSADIRKALWARTKDRHQETRYEAIVGLKKRNEIGIEAVIEKELKRKNVGTMLFDCVAENRLIQFKPQIEKIYFENLSEKQTSPFWFNQLERCLEQISSNE